MEKKCENCKYNSFCTPCVMVSYDCDMCKEVIDELKLKPSLLTNRQRSKTMDYIEMWDTQIVAIERQLIWVNYDIRYLMHLDSLANSYLSKCVRCIQEEHKE